MQRILCLLALCTPLGATAASLQKVDINFAAVVGERAFSCGESYDNIGSSHSKVTPSDWRFYVSDVALLTAKGDAVPLQLAQDGVWQYRNVALLDFENGSGPCRNGNAGLHTKVSGSVPKGQYVGVRFTLGVPFDLNHNDPTLAPAPLNSSSMFWAWQSGYKFVKIDFASNGLPQAADAPGEGSMADKVAMMAKIAAARAASAVGVSGVPGKKMSPRAAGFSVHLGSTACTSASLTAPPAAACGNPNRVTVTFARFNPKKQVIQADLASLLQDTNVDVNAPDSAPGCMSAPNDGDCPGVMAGFGLPFNNQPAPEQRFFKVK